jgi:putative transcriptional regulator
MIQLQIRALIAKRSADWNRKITITEISNQTGISRMTLNRIMRDEYHNTVIIHVDKLCGFFECQIGDLLSYESISQESNWQDVA